MSRNDLLTDWLTDILIITTNNSSYRSERAVLLAWESRDATPAMTNAHNNCIVASDAGISSAMCDISLTSPSILRCNPHTSCMLIPRSSNKTNWIKLSKQDECRNRLKGVSFSSQLQIRVRCTLPSSFRQITATTFATLPPPFTPDFKLISFTNPFVHSLLIQSGRPSPHGSWTCTELSGHWRILF